MISEIIFRMKALSSTIKTLMVMLSITSYPNGSFSYGGNCNRPIGNGKTHLSSMAPLYSLSRDGYSGGLQVLSYRNHILLTDAYTIRVEVAKKIRASCHFRFQTVLNSPEFECLLDHGGNCRVCVLAG